MTNPDEEFMNTRKRHLMISGLMASLLTLAGCSQKNEESTSATTSSQAVVSSQAAVVNTNATVPMSGSCDGVAPSGDLVPVRIDAANTTRTEEGLYEGPVWINGALYFSDFTFSAGFPSRIQKLDLAGLMTTVIEDSGSNGLAVDKGGSLIAGTHKYKSLSRFNLATGERTSIVEQYNNNVFNSPNDIAIANDGTVYFTDPAFQKMPHPVARKKLACIEWQPTAQ